MSVVQGATATLTITVSGTGPFTYQWRKDGNNITGATTATLSLTTLKSSDAGSYSVVVSNSVGSVTSSSATLSVTASAPPTITVQPTSQTASTGSTVTFSITATGSTPLLSYAWYHNGHLQPGMLPTFTLTNVSAVDAGDYYVRVANMTGESVVSQTFTLTVLAPTSAPTILSQPTAQTVPTGGSVTFLVSASGNPTPTVQWYKRNSGAIAGATTSSLTLATVAAGDAGDYYAVATNSSGSATSSDAHLTVSASDSTVAPTIVQQPAAQNVTTGGSVTFSVVANGTPAPTYQWYFNGAAIGGATASSFSRTSAAAADAGSYSVRVSNSAGTVDSSAVLLSVLAPEEQLAITTQPVSKTVAAGSSVTFTVAVKGPPALNYQWFKDGQPINGAIDASLTLSNVQSANAGNYSVTVSSRLTAAQQIVTSNTATLVVSEPTSSAVAPAITSQPTSQSTPAGSSVSFSVTASGTVPLSYQWRKGGSVIAGATSSTLSLANVQSSDAGSYTVVVSNSAGSVTSSSATLSVVAAMAPSITSQPHARTADLGSSVDFFFGATGSPTPRLQWRKNSVPIAGATTNTLIIPKILAADAADYDCIATNSAGSVTSAPARLTVNTPLILVASALTGNLVAGGSANFSVTATGTAPISYQWFHSDTALSGATAATLSLSNLSANDAGDYKVLVTGPGGTRSATFKLVLGTTVVAPVITQQPAGTSVDLGATVTFTAAASGTPAPTWQWRHNGVTISGANSASYTIPAAQLVHAGAYTAIATNSAGSSVTADAVLELNISSAAAAATGIYFGKLGANGADGDFALQLRRDGTGVMLINLPASKSAILVTDFLLNADGTFSVTGTVLAAPKSASDIRARAAASQAISGSIAGDGTVSGSVGGAALSGTRTTGDTATAGFYSATATGASTGAVYTILAPDGKALVVAQTATGVEGGTATVTTSGASSAINVTTASGATLATTVNADTGAVTTTADKGALAGTTFAGLRDDVEHTDRLANISTRGRAGAGAELMIAGFVVAGTDPRPVLIRAVGPTLSSFGLTGVLADSRLELYRDSTKIFESDNWGAESSATAITAAASRVGAFTLPASGKDAALLVTLDPGAYTAQVSGLDGTGGVALVEVYDAGEGAASSSAPRLINISTRANVGLGEDVLIAGIVVTGNTPKRVLVRAIGPTLAAFGLNNALADPVLKILSGSTTISSNDDWGSQSGNVPASDIASAAASVGAFALSSGSKDASLLITLQPGNYTAQISGKNDATGIALVEVYELP